MPTPYDELPYPGSPFTQTHPDRLGTIATLFGMNPAPVERCRVLELGCGDGGNLIPMAFGLPRSIFTGIDLTGSAIARGQELIDELRLANIHLKQLDLMDVTAEFGEFDYIIAHGLYSWVPPRVRERILEICKSHLASNGIAFISYNTYPGGHLLEAIREMMFFHTRNAGSPRERLAQARDFLGFLFDAHPENDAQAQFLKADLKSCLERAPEVLYHDELAEHNHRFYFHEFAERLAAHGLQYLSEARTLPLQDDTHAGGMMEEIEAFSRGDPLVREQYLDFLKLRNFRQTLLCHAGAPPEQYPKRESVAALAAAAQSEPSKPNPDLCSDASETFVFPIGKLSTNHPLGKAALWHLGRVWPRPIAFSELLAAARTLCHSEARLDSALAEDAAWLSEKILKLFAVSFVELHSHIPGFAAAPSEQPVTSPLARAQIKRGRTVTTLHHASVEVQDDTARELLLLLDGTRNRAQLLAELRRDPSREITPEQLEANLNRLARMALLAA